MAHTAITLLAPYVAWIIGERAHTSAVLACVAGGIYLRQGFSAIVPPATRLQSKAVWDLLVFILNGVIFILIGLQLGAIREAGLPRELRHPPVARRADQRHRHRGPPGLGAAGHR